MSIDWTEFRALVERHERFVLTSHVRPDCDALGSELGLAGILRALGKVVRIVNGQATPPNLAFIDPQRQIEVIGTDVDRAALEDTEVVVILDTSAWVQLGPMAELIRALPARRVVLDHHVSEDDMGAVYFKDVTAEATGRLVVEAAVHLQVGLTPEMARPLFAALATDTGWFRFGSVTDRTFQAAARLLAAGAEPAWLYNQLYEQDTVARLRLRGVALERVTTELDGRLVYTELRASDFERCGALPSDTEDLINMTLKIAGTEAAVIFMQQPGGEVKVSFRSRGRMDCSEVAARFGGGGHLAASGATMHGALDEVKALVLDAVRTAMS